MTKQLNEIARNLISQYGEEAETIAMLRAAEYAASQDIKNWKDWEEIINLINSFDNSPSHDG